MNYCRSQVAGFARFEKKAESGDDAVIPNARSPNRPGGDSNEITATHSPGLGGAGPHRSAEPARRAVRRGSLSFRRKLAAFSGSVAAVAGRAVARGRRDFLFRLQLE